LKCVVYVNFEGLWCERFVLSLDACFDDIFSDTIIAVLTFIGIIVCLILAGIRRTGIAEKGNNLWIGSVWFWVIIPFLSHLLYSRILDELEVSQFTLLFLSIRLLIASSEGIVVGF
jgi:hypothetical protein